LAERGGFEPPIGYEPIHAFQACDLNHSSISPAFPTLSARGPNYSSVSGECKGFLPKTGKPVSDPQGLTPF
jgi:hypothetical protein